MGHNIWGGKRPENPARFGGKSYGIISIKSVLYMWVSPGSGSENYTSAKLFRSENYGKNWKPASWEFKKNDGLILPTFLQFGKDYSDARDRYVYIYANQLKQSKDLSVQKPGEIILMRVPKDKLMEREKYEFFAGQDNAKEPKWKMDFSARKPVFLDAENGVGWNTSVSYNVGLKRYFLITEHKETMKGNIGIFEAPEPWGPWSTVLYENQFGKGEIQQKTFFYNFSNKWLSKDGKEFVLIFTGIEETDSWNTVSGKFYAHDSSSNQQE